MFISTLRKHEMGTYPNDIFYNTGIATYIWVLSNKKAPHRKGKVQLINANEMYEKRRKSLGSKRNIGFKRYYGRDYGDREGT